jgi:hypothetical protein
MKSSRKFVVAFASATSLGFVSAQAYAQTTAPGPYYATPSWDQTLPASTRFIVLSNMGGAAVLDRETGLVWERSPDPAERNWFDSFTHCRALTTGNRKGWRLPTIHELQTLLDPSVSEPSLPPGVFLGILITAPPVSNSYWASTTDVEPPTNAYLTNFGTGGISSIEKTNAVRFVGSFVFSNHAWCVRGQGGTESQ